MDFKMDPKDNNNEFDSVQLELISIKAELKEEPVEENREIPEASTVSGQKRKYSEENFSTNRTDETSHMSSSNENVKRRRYSNSQDEDSTNNQSSERAKYVLSITNTPGEWTSEQIIDFVTEQCGIHISRISDNRHEKSDPDFQIKLNFVNKEQLNRVLAKLKEKEVEGKLSAEAVDNNEDSQSDADSENTIHPSERPEERTEEASSSQEQSDLDANGFYMKEEYLKSLGIRLPLTKWVSVTNFRCDKSELKEVLELCGKVLICSVVTVTARYANVMYSHPLEAVQAISMLNGQKFYGQCLKVTMINNIDPKTLLPKGLTDVGPGLGKLGKPLPDLENQYEKLIKGQNTSIDAHLFKSELLDKIGVSLDENIYVRPINNNNNFSNDDDIERSRESSPSSLYVTNRFGPIGQRPLQSQTPTSHNLQTQNSPTLNFSNQTVSPIGTNGSRGPSGPVSVLGSSGSISGLLQGPRGPNIAPRGPTYPNCPPIPGVEANEPINFNGVVPTGPMSAPLCQTRPIRSMIRPNPVPPRLPGPSNRFPEPGSSVFGPRPTGTVGPRPAGSVGSNPAGPVGPRPAGPVVPNPAGPVGHNPAGPAGPNPAGPVGPNPAGPAGPNPAGPMGPRLAGPSGRNALVPVGPRPAAPVGLRPAGPMGPRPAAPAGPIVQLGPRPRQNGPTFNRPIFRAPNPGNVQMFRSNDLTTLYVSNLPPTTNFVNLGQRLSEFGTVVFLELTTPGCAVVRFATPAETDRCFQNYRNIFG